MAQTSIYKRLRLLMYATVALSVVLSVAVLTAYEYAGLRRELRADLDSLGEVMALTLQAPLAFRDQEAAAENLAALGALPRMQLAVVLTPDGRPFAIFRAEDVEVEPITPPASKGTVFRNGLAEQVTPIRAEGERLGTLYLRLRRPGLAALLPAFAIIAGLVLLTVGSSVLLLRRGLKRIVVRRLGDLAAAVRNVTETEDYGVRLTPHGHDEISQLTHDFNTMLHVIGQRDRTLHEANTALAESERQMRTLLSNLPGMAYRCRLDPRWPMSFVSEGSRDLTGYAPDALTNHEATIFYIDLIHPDDRQEVWEVVRQSATTNSTFQLVYRIQRQDGVWRWVWEQGRAVGRQGPYVMLEGLVMDITERREAEQALVRQRALLRSVIDLDPNLIFIKDRDGRYELANRALADLMGREPDDLIGRRDVEILFDAEEAGIFRRKDLHVLETDQPHEYHETITDADGRPHRMRTAKIPLHDDEGKPNRVLGIVNDITALKKKEDELREQRQFLRKIIDTDRSLIFAKDRDGVYRLANKAIATAYGTTVDDLVGKTDADVNPHKDEVAFFACKDREVLERQEPVFIPEERLTYADGEEHWLQVMKIPLFGPDGVAHQALGVASDITHRKKMENELRDSLALLDAFLESSPVGHVFLDVNLRYMRLSRDVADFMDLTPEDFIGRHPSEILPPDLAGEYVPIFEQVLQTQKPVLGRSLQRRSARDGEVHDFATSVYPVTAEDRLLGVGISVTDVTDLKRAEGEVRRLNAELEQDVARRKQVEVELRTSLAQLDALLESSPVSHILLDKNLRYLRLSRKVADFEGLQREDFIGHRPEEVVSASLAQRFVPLMQQALQTRQPIQGVPLSRRTNGDENSYTISIFPVTCDAALMGVGLSITNVTDLKRAEAEVRRLNVELETDIAHRKQVEAELRKSLAQLDALLDATPIGYSLFDLDLRYVRITRSLAELIGRSPESFVGKTLREAVPEQLVTPFEPLLKHVYETGRPIINKPVYMPPADGGGDRNTIVSLYPVFVDDELIGVGSSVADVTELRRAEEEVRRLNAELEERVRQRTAELEQAYAEVEDLYNNAPCGYHSLSPEGVFLRINDTELAWLGQRRDEVVGKKRMTDFLTPEAKEFFASDWPRFLAEGVTREMQVDLVQQDGSVLPVLVSATAMYDASGRMERTRSVVLDFSATRRAQQQADRYLQQMQQANQELEAFAYSVSHDLRAPLRAIHGFSQILVEEHRGALEDEAQRYLDLIWQETRRMGQLIDDLLRFSRAGRATLDKREVDMAALVREVLDDLADERRDRRIRFRLGALPPCRADRSLLKQVLTNLLSNAIKFTRRKEQAIIEVDSTEVDGQTAYFVRDNGVGFDMAYADKLFGVFQRLHSSTDFEGTGVGLALSARIIKRHGGRIWAEGEVDRGATFYFTVGQEPA